MMQMIQALLDEGIPAANILYLTFDQPVLNLAGIEAVIDAWCEREPSVDGLEYVFLDEVQFLRDWRTWVKHEHNFNRQRLRDKSMIADASLLGVAQPKRQSLSI